MSVYNYRIKGGGNNSSFATEVDTIPGWYFMVELETYQAMLWLSYANQAFFLDVFPQLSPTQVGETLSF